MREAIDFSSWIGGWTSLVFVVAYGVFLFIRSRRLREAQRGSGTSILVTGSRGKSGTVRLIHGIMSLTGEPVYGKVTGTTAVELYPDGEERETVRIGAASVNEMPESVMRAHTLGARVGVFECMAVTPDLIELVSSGHVKPDIAVIPAIRLDHLEEEGLTEFDIGRSIIDSLGYCKTLVVGIDQPDLLEYAWQFCRERDIALIEAHPQPDQPVVPGHHPTNVAVALAVAEHLGMDAQRARAYVVGASIEPRALSVWTLPLEKGGEISLIDLGGANDPQSAYEAMEGVLDTNDYIVPIVVNRWERPLRSLVFLAAILGRFPVVGISGTLGRVARWFHTFSPEHARTPHEKSLVFSVTRKQARSPELLAEKLLSLDLAPKTSRVTLLLVENTHEPTVDALRNTFTTRGQESTFVNWRAR